MTIKAALLILAGLSASDAALAQPVYKDRERFDEPGFQGQPTPPLAPGPGRPARRIIGDPGYVGSDYGLGKPSFTGLGSRPDWGRSSE
jgi:hypothetical protein